jgi:ABC-type multidrug transport system fused ATPase/permease subunit
MNSKKPKKTEDMRTNNEKRKRFARLKIEISTAFWILGFRNKRVLQMASGSQILLSCSNILLLLLMGPLMISITGKSAGILNLRGNFEIALSRNQIFILVTSLITVTNLSGLLIRKLVLNSLAAREAEVTTAFLQASILEREEGSKSRNSSELTHIASESLRKIFNSIFAPFVTLVGEVATLIAVFLGLAIVNLQLTLILVGYFMTISALLTWKLSKKQEVIGREHSILGAKTLKILLEINLLKKELSLAHKDGMALDSFYATKFRQVRVQSQSVFMSALPRSLLELMIIFGLGLFVWIHEVYQSGPILASVALFVAAAYRILPSLNSVIVIHGNLRNALPVLEELNLFGRDFSIRSSNLKFTTGLNSRNVTQFRGDLCFEKVSFAYFNSTNQVLDNLSIEIAHNSTIWIHGPSGSGKSTFLSLAVGLMTPTKGRVDLRTDGDQIRIDETLGGVSFLSQSSPLFDASFAYNIALRETTSDDLPLLRMAAERSGILARILEAPEYFNEIIGENGTRLSAGERQRLGLARSLFFMPSLLILDEPTANLDSNSEAIVFESLQKLKGSMTILIASHRPVPVDVFDKVLELGNSK